MRWIGYILLASWMVGCAAEPNFFQTTVVQAKPDAPADSSDASTDASQGETQLAAPGSNQDPKSCHRRAQPDPALSPEAQCAQQAGIPLEQLKVISSHEAIEVPPGTSILLKVRGDQPRVELKLESKEGAQPGYVCLFVAGNRSQIEINAKTGFAGLYVKQSGNQSRVRAVFDPSLEAKDVPEIRVEQSGNRHLMVIKGAPRVTTLLKKGNALGVRYE